MNHSTWRARWVLPVDAPPIAGGYVAVADERLVAVGAADPAVGAVTDLGDVVLMPGLVNAHTHLEFSGLSRPLGRPGMSLPEWIRSVIADRSRGDRDAAVAIAAGRRESAAAGVTTIGEIATSSSAMYDVPETPRTLLFQEAIGFSAGRVDSVFAEMERRLDVAPSSAGLSPHAPYTVHPLLVVRLVQLATHRRRPIAMHLAESREELQLLATGDGPFRDLLDERSMWDGAAIPRGTRPLDYLRQLATAPRALVIHGNYLSPDEMAFIGERRDRMSVVYCPRTHAYFGHDRYPLPALLAAGVRLALGTDSRASNPDLNLRSELRTVAQQYPTLDPATLLKMATLDAATALGVGDETGSLTPGKRADLVAFRCGEELADPYEAVLVGDGGPISQPVKPPSV